MSPEPEARRLFCLFSISSTTAYTTIQGCRPTDDYYLLEKLRSHVTEIRPPTAAMTVEIIETDESCSPTATGRETIRRSREQLS